jgi:hypothetical protein
MTFGSVEVATVWDLQLRHGPARGGELLRLVQRGVGAKHFLLVAFPAGEVLLLWKSSRGSV